MRIRAFRSGDLDPAVNLTIDTFRPFFVDYVRPRLGGGVFRHQHGTWEQDYRDELPTLHRPERGHHVAVAVAGDARSDGLAGLIAWRNGDRPRHGEIYLLAVAPGHRRRHLGLHLCEHAIAAMRDQGVAVVQVGTGGDPFHAPARALYRRLGLTMVPTAVFLGAI